MNMKDKYTELIRKIIPYASEYFVTYPLWEEGDYRPTLSIWQVVKGHNLKEVESNYEKMLDDIQSYFRRGWKDWDYIIVKDSLNMSMAVTLIHIFQKGNILDENITPNYSVLPLMKVAGELIEYLKND